MSSVTEGLMVPGSWSVELDDTAPLHIRKKLVHTSVLAVTRTRLADSVADRDAVLAASIYSGVLTGVSNKMHDLRGYGLLWFLGNGNGDSPGNGASGSPDPTLPATFTDIITTWLDASGSDWSNNIGYGDSYAAAAGYVESLGEKYNFWPPLREALDQCAKVTGNEYRMRPDGLVDYGNVGGALFVTDPTVVIADGYTGGRDVGSGLNVLAGTLDQDADIDDFCNVNAITQNGDPGWAAGGAGFGSFFGYTFDPTNFGLNMQRNEFIDSTDVADATAFGQARSEELGALKRNISCEVDDEDITRWLVPGDWVYVYDPESGLIDTSNAVYVRGSQLSPLKVRCMGYTWPIREGMGVYVICADGVGEVVDISRYVKWTNTQATLTLDNFPRTIRGFVIPRWGS